MAAKQMNKSEERKWSYEPWYKCKKCKFKFSLQHALITFSLTLHLIFLSFSSIPKKKLDKSSN